MNRQTFNFKIFEEVKSIAQIADAAHIREKVFIEEQQIPAELEFDEYDFIATHVVMYIEEIPIGTGRLLLKSDNKWYIGRIAVLKEYRGKSYGRDVVLELMRIAKNKGIKEAHIHSQVYAIPFYEKLGWKAFGEEFEEDGIQHKEMSITLN